ncbi:MAG: PilZ domain-containing protein [Treponema sp.]|nr:PilZ domain-containing protein [Treponema sp.]
MGTPVGRIEREYLFKVLYDAQLPIMYMKDRAEYTMTLEHPVNDEMTLRPDRSIGRPKPLSRLDLLFKYRGQVVDFSAEIQTFHDDLIVCKVPQMLYKDLDRDYLRVDTPSDLKIVFTFRGDRYKLSLPKLSEYETLDHEELIRSLDPRNLSGLIMQITNLLKNYADGYKIVNFKDKKPENIEERIVSETGKTLFVPSTVGRLPKNDPYPKKRIITEDLFKRYLESTGTGQAYLAEMCTRFIKQKYDDGIYSDAWIPILFQEYVIGYVHIWIDKEDRLPIDYSVIDNVYEYTKVLAFALKENGYFEHGKVENESFRGRVLDMSASGLLFAYPHSSVLASTLLIDSELTVTIEAPNRSINVIAKIVRRFKDKSAQYFGCHFINIVPEDIRFLFEHLYGRHMDDDTVTDLLIGQV